MTGIDTSQLSALLLAGGQGSRLGGRDKGLMPWQGRPVAAHLAELIRPLVGELIISCNRHQALYQLWADQLVADQEPGYPGPLAGILAGLQACSGSHLLIIPCDLPYLETALPEHLLQRAATQPDIPWLVRSGDAWQPLLSVIPRHLLPAMQLDWAQGQRSPLRWLRDQPHGVLALPGGDRRLYNANDLKDWPE